MHKVYYNNYKIVFKPTLEKIKGDRGITIENESELNMIIILSLLESEPISNEFIFYSSNPNNLKNKFDSLFEKKVVAGGLVKNCVGDYLFIFKNGHWDLPKGHLEPGESLTDAAKREVQEETGIGGLEIVSQLPKTEHIFLERDGKWILKETNWFLMKTESLNTPKCQDEEAITDAKWITPQTLDSILMKAFASIKQVILSHLEAYGFDNLRQIGG